MRSSLFLVLAAAVLILSVDAVGRLRASVSSERLDSDLRELPTEPLTEFERESIRDTVDAAVEHQRTLPRTRILRASVLQRLAEESRSGDQVVQLYCDALVELGKAVASEPQNARYLIGWANVRGVLGPLGCAGERTNAELSRVTDLAVRTDPTNTNVMYAAGLISLWSGDLPRARTLFRRVVEFGMNVTPGQVRQIASVLVAPEDVRQVIPPRFPHVVRWSEAVSELFPERRRALEGAFAGLQIDALLQNESELRRGAIPRSLYWERLAGLAVSRPEATVRKKLDAEIGAHLARGPNPRLGAYFLARQNLQELPVVPAALAGDSRPAASALTRWNRNDRVAFDEAGFSVGFFSADRSLVRSIELWGQPNGVRVEPVGVKVLVSDDNQNWRELFDRFEIHSYVFERRPLIVVALDVEAHRYWKVHFGDSRRDRGLQNALGQMLRVYGVEVQRGGE